MIDPYSPTWQAVEQWAEKAIADRTADLIQINDEQNRGAIQALQDLLRLKEGARNGRS